MAIIEIKTGKSNTEDSKEDGKYLFFDRSKKIKKSSKYIFNGEYIVVPGEGSFTPHYVNGKFDLHQRTYAIKSKNISKILNKYLYYFILQNNQMFTKYSVGSTVPSLRLSSFNWIFKHSWPNINVQKSIIDIIEPLETFLKNLLTMFEKTKQIISTLPITNQTFKLNSILVKEKQTKKNILQISAKVLEKNNPLIYNYEPENTYKTNSFYVTENTLLFSSIRTYQKKIGLTPYEADINGTLYSYKILKNKLSIFYNLFNNNFWNKCNMLSEGTKMPVLSENDLLNNIELKKLKFEFERIDHIFILLNKLIISINKIKEKIIQILI